MIKKQGSPEKIKCVVEKKGKKKKDSKNKGKGKTAYIGDDGEVFNNTIGIHEV